MKKTQDGFAINIDGEMLKQMERDIMHVPFLFKVAGLANYVLDPILKVLGVIALIVIILNFS